MKRRESILLALGAAVSLSLLCPSLWRASLVPANFGDLYAYHIPLRHTVVSSLQSGRLPFWNPFIFCGLPLAANPQTALFYPVSLLAAVLPMNLSLTWDFAFHMLWAALGMMLLARREKLPAGVCSFLACAWAFSPFLLYRITEGIPTLLACLAWAPWCWLAFLAGRRGLLAAAWTLQFLSGHPQFLVVNAVGMAAWSLCHAQRGRLLGRLMIEAAMASGLAAVQWPATWEFLSHSVRKVWPQAFATAYSARPGALLTWLLPDVFGNPMNGTFRGYPSVFFESSGVFIGWLGLAAAALGLWRARAWRAWLLVALGVFLALGEHNPLYRAVCLSPAGLLRTPARYLFLSLWGLLLAAASGARFVFRGLPSSGVRAFLAAAAAAELLAWGHRFVVPQDAAPFLAANPAVARAVGGRLFRVLVDPALANPNKSMLYRAMNVNGYDAFYLSGYPDFAAASEGRAVADASRTYLSRAGTPAMRGAGVAYALTAGGALEAQAGALPLAYFAAQGVPFDQPRVAVSMERPERWRAGGSPPPGADRLVVTVPAYPGWRAWLNGKSVSPEPWGYFQAVNLPSEPPGTALFRAPATLVLDFQPTLWRFFMLIGMGSWAIWLYSWRGGRGLESMGVLPRSI